MENKLFIPRQLKTIEVDVEKKIYRVNGEDFGKGCSGFSIRCDGPNRLHIRMELDATVVYADYLPGENVKTKVIKGVTYNPQEEPEG